MIMTFQGLGNGHSAFKNKIAVRFSILPVEH